MIRMSWAAAEREMVGILRKNPAQGGRKAATKSTRAFAEIDPHARESAVRLTGMAGGALPL